MVLILTKCVVFRYQEEFLELSEIASGEFGVVKQARHRLDGIVYAVKVTKKSLRMNSRDEKVAMNEVFAHAALIKHKNVVRYYNSWVEKGSVRRDCLKCDEILTTKCFIGLHTKRVL